ncbi:hypothetical protein QN398_12560 [Pseudomonas sp. CCC2.2]|nr:hypothetical protein [Pseudomonas sp. CCC2.2]MEB0148373.1 hypothetical protein [Pseudomonas sp. CCC2.2]
MKNQIDLGMDLVTGKILQLRDLAQDFLRAEIAEIAEIAERVEGQLDIQGFYTSG